MGTNSMAPHMKIDFDLPVLPQADFRPRWEGSHFVLENENVSVLEYSTNLSGWNDALTESCEIIVGADHPFEKASRQHALSEIKKHLPQAKTILEIGCSSGYLLGDLKQHFPKATILGADVISASLQRLAQRLPNIPLFQFDLTQCPLPDNCVDVIVLLNVLEHIEQDQTALLQLKRILKPGGLLIIEVPAGPELYDKFDDYCQHYRRYSSTALAKLFSNNGFKIKNRSHLGALLYPAYRLSKLKDRYLKEDLNSQQIFAKNMATAQKNPLFKWVMQLELALGKKINYPFGIRCLLSCGKK